MNEPITHVTATLSDATISVIRSLLDEHRKSIFGEMDRIQLSEELRVYKAQATDEELNILKELAVRKGLSEIEAYKGYKASEFYVPL